MTFSEIKQSNHQYWQTDTLKIHLCTYVLLLFSVIAINGVGRKVAESRHLIH